MTITFESTILKVGSLQVIKVPIQSSKELSSRGIVMVQGEINDIAFRTLLEPDGKGSHWLEVTQSLHDKLQIAIGSTVSVSIEQTNRWIEPDIPEDISDAIREAGVGEQWESLTVRSKWEWIRWIRSTKNKETRTRRIDVACSKLREGDRNPCCFNASMCTVTEVSKSGKLMDS